jgi:hypothetical protein
MKKIIFAVLATALFIGCDSGINNGDKSSAQNGEMQNMMFYFKDKRVDICYAYLWRGGVYGGPAMTAVPCEKVQHLLVSQ